MKVKNEYVKIQTENKEITLRNYIYDSYLELFSRGQYTVSEDLNVKKFLGACYLKFDDELEDYTNATVGDFDIVLLYQNKDIVGNESSIEISYIYGTREFYEIYGDGYRRNIDNLNDYKNKKITAIGFGATYGHEIYACIDTSNYTIKINDDSFIITRKDILSSEATCGGYAFPLHLLPCTEYTKTPYVDAKYPMAVLYSVGFGRLKNAIEDELVLHDDFEVIQERDTVYGINMKIEAEKSIYPQVTSYAGNSKYPIKFYAEREIYPNINIQPNSSKYPLKSNYKYIIFKYRLYCVQEPQSTILFLDEYYTMNYPIGNIKGLFEIKNKIERK